MVMKKQSNSHWNRQTSAEPADLKKADTGLSDAENMENAENIRTADDQTATETGKMCIRDRKYAAGAQSERDLGLPHIP